MGCNNCSSGGGCGTSTTPAGCQNNGACMTSGCNKLDVYDWLSHMDLPSNYKAFNIVEVRFKGSRKDFYINHEDLYLEMGEMVAVESPTGGYDIGHISLMGELVRLQLKKNRVDASEVTKKIYRKVTDADIAKWQAAKDLEWETMHKARTLALNLGLSMKISDVDYQGDKTKATFYYTADGRVDFRELIKKMAEAFRIRIEMRQIGMRQEASRLGGIGACGRELCCSTWLTDFKTVSTSAARYQNLSLNTLKLAGQCGKLKCCLNYELDSYMDALKDIPNNIDRIETKKGVAWLQKTDIFKKLMWFSYPGEENWIPLNTQKVKELHQLNQEGVKPEDLGVVEKIEKVEKEVSFDFENVVGQDSLTRLDEKSRKRKKSKKKASVKKEGEGNKAEVVSEAKNQASASAVTNKAKPNNKRSDAKANKTPGQAKDTGVAKQEAVEGAPKAERSNKPRRFKNRRKGKDGGSGPATASPNQA
jgi:cell fate regulator YaaT (PSP1 superfamily)